MLFPNEQSRSGEFPPYTPQRTVFDNGVEADISDVHYRRGPFCDDRALLDATKRALRDATYVPLGRVVPQVRDGVVTLEGRTDYYYERAAAECAVRFLDGVRSVENRILVEPPAIAHEVRSSIAKALMRDAADDALQIDVQAIGGSVILQGVVHSRGERDAAERAAWSVSGVQTVIDNLMVQE